VKPIAFLGVTASASNPQGRALSVPDTIGAGVREIRVRDRSGAFRIIYVATFADAIYVLHAFQKKTRQTAKQDIELATSRLREQMARRR
jgi:phage-related protein